MFLADMVTKEQLIEQASPFLRTRSGYTKKQREINIRFIEQTLPLSRDKETTRLFLEARDLHRGVADYLGRFNTK